MDINTPLRRAWRAYWTLQKHRPEPTWARLLISAGLGVAIGVALVTLAAPFSNGLLKLAWWRSALAGSVVISLCISYTSHALYRSIELILSEAAIARICGWRDWRSAAFFVFTGITGTVLGGLLSLPVITWLFEVDASRFVVRDPQTITRFLLLTVAIATANWAGWRIYLSQQALKLQATESQLRLLQAQIEPHFLFNTLANVQSLIDNDAPRAKQMLEAFTDYLRAGLGQLRSADSTLGAELEMVHSYLLLLQARMGERLRFVVEADEQARAAVLPPLLLQPLVENAIHHGLEPKVEGGEVRITAKISGGRLEIAVDDDGQGMQAPRRAGQTRHGVALANVRDRLRTRYGEHAALTLQPMPVGTHAHLSLPYTAKP